MARKVPDCCPDAPTGALAASGKWTSRTYSISVVTPLFGGGPTPGENDPVTLIRGSSIRGHLRFWWRATRGASVECVRKLREQEGKIWGTAESPSPVVIRVGQVTRGEVKPWAEYQSDLRRGGVKSLPRPVDPSYPSYALFPFQGETGKVGGVRQVTKPPATVTTFASFELTLQWPAGMGIDKDIEAAMWSWVNFGGLGARTRRGCGALFCRELAPTPEDLNNIQEWYSGRLEYYGIDLTQESRLWPTLSRQLLVARNRANARLARPVEAWSQVIGVLQRFRQGVNIGRGPGDGGRPGRSFWPEADSLRRVTGQSFPRHKKPITTTENAFPRAEFGLPIIFHFKDGPHGGKDQDRPDVDPADCRLLSAGGSGRMASPLILKALAVGLNQAVPMILLLRTQPLDEVAVTFARIDKNRKEEFRVEFGKDEIRRPDLASYRNSPMAGRSPNGSALEAFMKFAHEEGFR